MVKEVVVSVGGSDDVLGYLCFRLFGQGKFPL